MAFDLADIAEKEAKKFYHGRVIGLTSNLGPIVERFPAWSLEEAEELWCAAFVYHCVCLAGYQLPPRLADKRIRCSFAGCRAWDEWSKLEEVNVFSQTPKRGRIVLYDRVFCNKEHDHIGIVVEVKEASIIVAEGNVGNVSAIVERPLDHHIRGFIAISEVKNDQGRSC